MIGLDTNILARYFVEEEGADSATQHQPRAARQLIESGQKLLLPKTVALELEWVLRGYYGFAADALHHASCRGCEALASFDDRGFAPRSLKAPMGSPLRCHPRRQP